MSNIPYNEIYDKIFSKSFDKSIYIFLCGGTGKHSIRNKVRDNLINLNKRKNLHILYPEDLFIDILNKNKKANLLELESFLADNSNVICIICESMGSAVELGVFTQDDKIRRKLIVAIRKKYSRKKSFIMMGPVRMLREESKQSVLVYNDSDFDNFCSNLSRLINKITKSESFKSKRFDNLASYIGFIPLILYFSKTTSRRDLLLGMKEFLSSTSMFSKDFDNYITIAIKYLLKARIIKTQYLGDPHDYYELTYKGYIEVEGMLSDSRMSEKTILHDRIRFDIMRKQLNSRSS